MFMFYSALILVTLERFENITIGFLMVNNPYRIVFGPHNAHHMALFELGEKMAKMTAYRLTAAPQYKWLHSIEHRSP